MATKNKNISDILDQAALFASSINATSFTTTGFLANTTAVVPTSNSSGQTFGNTISRWVITANSITVSTSATVTTTLSAGNTSITGFANASVSVNSALLTVGTAFIANTTGAYHTGTINATSFTVGASTVALLGTADQVVTGGARVTETDLGNSGTGTITPDPGDRPQQKYTNNGAHTLAPGTNYGNYIIDVLNTTGAGAITTSGWTKVNGDSFTTATTAKFRCYASVTSNASCLQVTKMVA